MFFFKWDRKKGIFKIDQGRFTGALRSLVDERPRPASLLIALESQQTCEPLSKTNEAIEHTTGLLGFGV